MRFVLIFVLLLIGGNCFAQLPSDSVFFEKSFWGYKFYKDGSRVNVNTLPSIMISNQDAYYLASRAKKNQVISAVIGGAGGFLIGLQLGNLLVGGEPNWTAAGIGAGLIIVAIPISSRSFKQSVEATNLYNEGLSKTSRLPGFIICVLPYGLGIKLEF